MFETFSAGYRVPRRAIRTESSSRTPPHHHHHPLPLIKYHQPEEIKTFAGKQDGERQRGRKDDIIMKPSKYLFYCVVESVPFYYTECSAKCSDSQHALWPEGPTVSQSPPWPAFIKDRYDGKIEWESWKENRKVKEWKGIQSACFSSERVNIFHHIICAIIKASSEKSFPHRCNVCTTPEKPLDWLQSAAHYE